MELENSKSHIAFLLDPKTPCSAKAFFALVRSIKTLQSMGIKEVSALFFLESMGKDAFYSGLSLLKAEMEKISWDVRFFGDFDKLSPQEQKILNAVDSRGREKALWLSVHYSGREEITRALKKLLAFDASQELSEEKLSLAMDADIAHPIDVVIAFGEEKKLQDALLWQMSYSEFVFVDNSIEDWTEEDVVHVMTESAQRILRYGR